MATQSHFLPRKFKGDKYKTMARWACDPATKSVIFVHGFAGTPSATWPNFLGLLPELESVRGVDLIFYGYDGKYRPANNSALAFFSFLQNFLTAPEQMINRTNALRVSDRTPFTYKKIIIAAHSLGAVISRRALLEAHQRQDRGDDIPWLEKVKLVLFAPAHLGAYSAEVVQSFLSSQGWWLANAIAHVFRAQSPLIGDLLPTSHVITSLKTDTETALAARRGRSVDHLVAKRVIWGLNDKVVKNGRFCEDEPADAPPLNANHVEVCKPRQVNDPIMSPILDTI